MSLADAAESKLLDQVVSERNALRAQNEHLWTIIRQQKAELRQLRDQLTAARTDGESKDEGSLQRKSATPVSSQASAAAPADRQILLARSPAVQQTTASPQRLLWNNSNSNATPVVEEDDDERFGTLVIDQNASSHSLVLKDVLAESAVVDKTDDNHDHYDSFKVDANASSHSLLLKDVLTEPPSEPAPAVPGVALRRDLARIVTAQKRSSSVWTNTAGSSTIDTPDLDMGRLRINDFADEQRASKRLSTLHQPPPPLVTQPLRNHLSFVPIIPQEALPLKDVTIAESARKSMAFGPKQSVMLRPRKESLNAYVSQPLPTVAAADMREISAPRDQMKPDETVVIAAETVQQQPPLQQQQQQQLAPPPSTVIPKASKESLVTLPRKSTGAVPADIPGRIRVLQLHLQNVNLFLEVISSAVRLNQNGKEFTVYNISLFTQHQPSAEQLQQMKQPASASIVERVEVWRVEKRYSDFLELHDRIKQRLGRDNFARLGVGKQPPNKTLFEAKNGLAPSKADKRRESLQRYLYSILSVEGAHVQAIAGVEQGLDSYVADHSGILEFLSTDVYEIADRRRDRMFDDAVMEGYLTKRGRKLQQWKRRFFVLRGDQLAYFERQEDAATASHIQASQNNSSSSKVEPLGAIKLTGAKVAKQKGDRERVANDAYAEYRHALMITELVPAKDNHPPEKKRTVLCAESDVERDEWLYYIARQVELLRLQADRQNRGGAAQDGSDNNNNNNLLLNPDTASINNDHGNTEKDTATNEMLRRPSSSDDMSTSARYGSVHILPSSRQQQLAVTNVQVPSTEESPRITSTMYPAKYFDFGRSNNASTGRLSLSMSTLPQPYNEAFGGVAHVFGVRLEDAIAYSRVREGYELPAVVYRCLEFLESKQAYLEEGIYRLSGSSADMKFLRSKFEKDGDVELLVEKRCDVHVAAGLLKLYLRELPESVLTSRLHRAFLDITDLLEREDRLTELARLVSLLPLPQYTLLRTLIAHLIIVVSNSEVNKMTMRNVSIVFSPTLAIPAGIFTLMMTEFEFIFDVRHEELPAGHVEELKAPRKEETYGSVIVTRESYPGAVTAAAPLMPPNLTKSEKRMSWRADHVTVEGRLHRNSQIYVKNAPITVKTSEQTILNRRSIQQQSDNDHSDDSEGDNDDDYDDEEGISDFAIQRDLSVYDSSPELTVKQPPVVRDSVTAFYANVAPPTTNQGAYVARAIDAQQQQQQQQSSSSGLTVNIGTGYTTFPVPPPPLVVPAADSTTSSRRNSAGYASSDAETVSNYGDVHDDDGDNMLSAEYRDSPVSAGTVSNSPLPPLKLSLDNGSGEFGPLEETK